jgi:putative signal transducing protein
VSTDAPPGWEEVFDGACLDAEVLQAVLEANGIQPVTRQLEAADLIPTIAFGRCRIYVMDSEVDRAREVLEQADSS